MNPQASQTTTRVVPRPLTDADAKKWRRMGGSRRSPPFRVLSGGVSGLLGGRVEKGHLKLRTDRPPCALCGLPDCPVWRA